jgi:hypothetical protein
MAFLRFAVSMRLQDAGVASQCLSSVADVGAYYMNTVDGRCYDEREAGYKHQDVNQPRLCSSHVDDCHSGREQPEGNIDRSHAKY